MLCIRNKGARLMNIYPNDSWGTFNAESEYKDVKGIHPNKTIDINLFTDDMTGEKFLVIYPVDESGQTDCTKSCYVLEIKEQD